MGNHWERNLPVFPCMAFFESNKERGRACKIVLGRCSFVRVDVCGGTYTIYYDIFRR